MKNLIKVAFMASLVMVTATASADAAKSLKHAKNAAHYREAIMTLLGTNMGPLGAMAKGKIPLNVKAVAKHATRINQLSLMIADYNRTDTSGFKIKTEALDEIWKKPKEFAQRIDNLTMASTKLQTVAMSGDEAAIKKAIGGVGKSCGGCHDDFKADD